MYLYIVNTDKQNLAAMKTQINHIEATDFSMAYSEAVITDMPVMTCAELDELTENLGVDILVF